MRLNLTRGLICVCLTLLAATGLAQDQAPAPGAQAPASPTPPLPKETPSNVNTGGGLSIEPLYWLTTLHPKLRGGAADVQADPGNLDYPGNARKAIGGVVSIPAGSNATLRLSFFQAQKSAGTTAPSNLNLFSTAITSGDLLDTFYKLRDYKVSYDYLTYYFKRGGSEFRVKTLWEIQYLTISNQIFDFVLLQDGSLAVNSAVGDTHILYPTLGIGLENTVSRHFRWDAKASGFGLPKRAAIGDVEASAAVRFGRVEFIVGGKAYHFKTSPHEKQYVSGTLYGPYAAVRLYWKKR